MNRRPRPAKLFFSFRSPYSWLTIRRLRQRVPDAFTALDWFPYWDPDSQTSADLAARDAQFHYVQMSRAKHLYLLMDTKRLSQAEGVAMAWPIDIEPHWEVPHLGWLAARRQGRAEQFYDEVVAARWQRGADICEPDVIADCAERAGVNPELVVGAPSNADLRAEGVDCLERAYLDDVFGIPYLKWSTHRFWGLDRLDAFLAVWQREPAFAAAGAGLAGSGGNAGQPESVSEDGAMVSAGYETDSTGGCG